MSIIEVNNATTTQKKTPVPYNAYRPHVDYEHLHRVSTEAARVYNPSTMYKKIYKSFKDIFVKKENQTSKTSSVTSV